MTHSVWGGFPGTADILACLQSKVDKHDLTLFESPLKMLLLTEGNVTGFLKPAQYEASVLNQQS